MNKKNSNEKGNKLIKYKKVLIPLTVTAVTFIALNSLGITNKVTTTLKDTYQKAMEVVFNKQEKLEINRDNTPQIEVDLTNKTVTLNYDNTISEMQYRIDGENEDWKEYNGAFPIEENVIIQTRYKKQDDTEYTIGSSKVITDLKYSISLIAPEVNVTKETTNGIEKGKISLSSTDEQDKTIVYETSITRYSLNEEGLLNSDGSINEAAVSNMDSVIYSKLEASTDSIYTKLDNKNIEISKSGIYKIKVRASTNGGFVKSEEVEKYLKIDNVVKTDLITFTKVKSNTNYEFDKIGTNEYKGICSEENIVVSFNVTDDIIFRNNIITYNGITLNESTQNPIETISTNGWHKRVVTVKVGEVNIDYTYNIKLGHTGGEAATCITDQTCIDCGKILANKIGHTEGAEATCTEDQICTVCNEVITPKLGHNTSGGEGTPVKEATCLEAGYGYYICSRCGKESDVSYEISKSKHLYITMVKTANRCYKCKWYDLCGSYTVHDPGSAATCTTSQKCKICQYVLKDALGHDYKKLSSYTSINSSKHKTHECTRCSSYLSDSHDSTSKWNNKIHWTVCTYCNYKSSEKSHTFEYAPTGSNSHRVSCSCGYSSTGGHSYTLKCYKNGNVNMRCSYCKYCKYCQTIEK